VLECYRRADSIVPQQALALENSSLAGVMAEKIAGRIGLQTPDADFIRQAFLLVLCDDPNAAEVLAATAALTRLTTAAKTAGRADAAAQARVNLIQALLNHNDFVTVR